MNIFEKIKDKLYYIFIDEYNIKVLIKIHWKDWIKGHFWKCPCCDGEGGWEETIDFWVGGPHYDCEYCKKSGYVGFFRWHQWKIDKFYLDRIIYILKQLFCSIRDHPFKKEIAECAFVDYDEKRTYCFNCGKELEIIKDYGE